MGPEGILSVSIFALTILLLHSAWRKRQFFRIYLALLVLCLVPAAAATLLRPEEGTLLDHWMREVLRWGITVSLVLLVLYIVEKVRGD